MKTGIELITEKRKNHSSKGWTLQHDQEHIYGEIAKVAAVLVVKHTDAFVEDELGDEFSTGGNPWGLEENPDVIDRLATAGALIAAEIDRLNNREK